MFDAGLFEFLVITIVALLVVGPERLPKLALTIGTYIGRLQRVWQHAKYEIEREVHNAEIKQATDRIGDDLHDIVNDLGGDMQEISPGPEQAASIEQSNTKDE